MAENFSSSTLVTAVGASLVLWSISTTGQESQLTGFLGVACCCFALGVLWARRPWRRS